MRQKRMSDGKVGDDVQGEPRFFALAGDITHALALTPMT
jgi:hypothetical protein